MQHRLSLHCCRVVAAWCACSALAQAQEDQAGSAQAGPAPSEARARAAADAGAFSPWTQAARSNTQRALVRVLGGYVSGARDAQQTGGSLDSSVQGALTDRISLRAGGSSAPASERWNLRAEGKLDALRQETYGVDLAFTAGYETFGFNQVSALVGSLALGRSLGQLQLLANLAYGRGVEAAEEHYAQAGAAALLRVGQRVQLGVDSRFSIDLERDEDEPPGEREWELQAGPLVTVTAGPVAVTGGAGLSANRLRLEPGTNVGALGYLGFAAAF